MEPQVAECCFVSSYYPSEKAWAVQDVTSPTPLCFVEDRYIAEWFSATPDLISVCEALVFHYSDGDDGLDEAMRDGLDTVLVEARNALSKARGIQS